MSRKLAVLGGLALGVVLWVVMAWPSPEDDAAASVAGVEEPPPPPAAAPAPAGAKAPEPAPAAAPEPAQPTPPAKPAVRDFIQGDQGPVAEYRKTYESESRDRLATDYEQVIRGGIELSKAPPDMYKSVMCRETICKIEMRWSMDRMQAYTGMITRIGVGGHGNAKSIVSFAVPLALSPMGPPDADGLRLVEVYLKRKPPDERGGDKR